MSRVPIRSDDLEPSLARVLKWGTVVAIGTIVLGLAVAALAGGLGSEEAGRGILVVLADGGPASIVTAGLLALALVPLAEAIVAVSAFARLGERPYLVISTIVLLLLAAGLGVAAVTSALGG